MSDLARLVRAYEAGWRYAMRNRPSALIEGMAGKAFKQYPYAPVWKAILAGWEQGNMDRNTREQIGSLVSELMSDTKPDA